MDEKILRLRELLNESHYTIAVTGAGISVSAGIMAFAGMNLPAVLQMTSTTVLKTAPGHYYNVARKAFLGPVALPEDERNGQRCSSWRVVSVSFSCSS